MVDYGLSNILDVEFAILDVLDNEGYEPNSVEFIEDPHVPHVWAVRVKRERLPDFDCIVNLQEKTVDEVEFEHWPPRTGNLKFFL